MFLLHKTLSDDCFVLGDFELSQLLLMNDCHYPWFILVPRRHSAREIFELSKPDQTQLAKESAFLGKNLNSLFQADKLNIAALGNIVEQLHIHHIVRYKNDDLWPKPIWGLNKGQKYDKNELFEVIDKLKPSIHKESELSFCWDKQWL